MLILYIRIFKLHILKDFCPLCEGEDAAGGLVSEEIIFVKMSLMVGPGPPWSFSAAGGECVFNHTIRKMKL